MVERSQWSHLKRLAADHDLQIRQVLGNDGSGYAFQFVYQPNESYQKYFVGSRAETLPELVELTVLALEEDMNIFSTNLFEYLSGEMIGDKDVVLTIKDVALDEVSNGRTSDEKPIVTFLERKKKWVLNKTSARALADTLGAETDEWRGHRVVLHAPHITAFGRTMRAIRVKQVLPRNGNGNGPDKVNEDLFAD